MSGRTAQTGVLVAATIVPETFAPSLTSRSWTDQGLITGFATSLDYLLTVTAKDTLAGIASAVEPVLPRAVRERPQPWPFPPEWPWPPSWVESSGRAVRSTERRIGRWSSTGPAAGTGRS